MVSVEIINTEVVYALPERAHIVSLQAKPGTTIRQAIMDSGIVERCPEIDLEKNKVGIFGKLLDLDTVLKEGDRVEIYRNLRVDPKEARRKRAEKKIN